MKTVVPVPGSAGLGAPASLPALRIRTEALLTILFLSQRFLLGLILLSYLSFFVNRIGILPDS